MAENDSRERLLLRFANEAEDAAAGLHQFRESLPRSATQITAVVSELFAISSELRNIQSYEGTRHYGDSFYRIRDNLGLLFGTLNSTLHEIFRMFGRSQERPAQMIWEDLNHRMDQVEGFSLQERLEWYRDFLEAQFAVLEGRSSSGAQALRSDLIDLHAAQERAQRQTAGRRPSHSGANTPRPPRINRPTMPRMDTPSTPTVISDEWDPYPPVNNRPPVPDPPLSPLSPQSPTFTSSSSQTMSSSQTSYSSDPLSGPGSAALIHWAQTVFDGSQPLTQYKPDSQRDDRSACFGPADISALPNLGRDGFQRALQLPFDEERLWVRLYWRPADHRARILIMTKDMHGQPLQYCTPLTNLKMIRSDSVLQLCRARRGDGRYSLWARLNFLFHERMVLFYSTFVAMKRQDQRGVAHPDLVDDFELEADDERGEQELFAGQIKHGDMYHAIRLFRDRGSGVVRLEASALRGPRKDVPIWTAFVTKYAYDPDWAHFEGNGVVSFAAIRPDPSVFIMRYEPPKNRAGHYVLPFTTNEDARMFMETWSGLCRSYGRHL